MYQVLDNITGEVFEFEDKLDAEMVAQRRLEMHRSGYNLRRYHISPISNAVLMVKGKVYTICLG